MNSNVGRQADTPGDVTQCFNVYSIFWSLILQLTLRSMQTCLALGLQTLLLPRSCYMYMFLWHQLDQTMLSSKMLPLLCYWELTITINTKEGKLHNARERTLSKENYIALLGDLQSKGFTAELEQWRWTHLATSPQLLSNLYIQFSAILNATLYVKCCCLPLKKTCSQVILTATISMNGAHPTTLTSTLTDFLKFKLFIYLHVFIFLFLMVLLARLLPCYWVIITSVSEPPPSFTHHHYNVIYIWSW